MRTRTLLLVLLCPLTSCQRVGFGADDGDPLGGLASDSGPGDATPPDDYDDPCLVSACAPSELFAVGYGGGSIEFALGLALGPDDAVHVAGFSGTSVVSLGGSDLDKNGIHDVVAAAYDSNGVHRWSANGGTGGFDEAYAIAADEGGQSYLTGKFTGDGVLFGEAVSSGGGEDAFVAALANDGSPRWLATFAGPQEDEGRSVAVTSAGMVFVAGWFRATASVGIENATSSGDYDGFLLSIDQSGTESSLIALGGPGLDVLEAVSVDAAGNVYVAGGFSATMEVGSEELISAGGIDAFVASFDPSGSVRWAQRWGGAGDDLAHALTVDASGNTSITGWSDGSINTGNSLNGPTDTAAAFVSSYDPSGTPRWSQTWGTAGRSLGSGIDADSRGNIFVTGSFTSTIDFGGGAQPAPGGDGSADVFVVSVSAEGRYRWSLAHGGAGGDEGASLIVDSAGDIWAAGWFASGIEADSGPLVSAGGVGDIWMMKLRSP